jgi:hypothetical protein
LDDMASPHQPNESLTGPLSGAEVDYPPEADEAPSTGPDVAPVSDDRPPPVLRLRVAVWDMACTVALLILLVVLATATTWPTKLWGFLGNVCTGDTCGPVPFGADMYIYPVVWGGIGAAIAAAGIGPFVSMLKGWYMSFWPVLALTILMVSSVAGFILTTYSERYWG